MQLHPHDPFLAQIIVYSLGIILELLRIIRRK